MLDVTVRDARRGFVTSKKKKIVEYNNRAELKGRASASRTGLGRLARVHQCASDTRSVAGVDG